MIVQLYDHAPLHYCAQPLDFKYMYVEQDKVYRMVISSVGVIDACEREKLGSVFAAIESNIGPLHGNFIDLITFRQGKQKIRMSMALVTKREFGDDRIYEIESTKDSVVITGVYDDDGNWCSNITENKKTKPKRKATGKITRR
jgi:hypothetical protein